MSAPNGNHEAKQMRPVSSVLGEDLQPDVQPNSPAYEDFLTKHARFRTVSAPKVQEKWEELQKRRANRQLRSLSLKTEDLPFVKFGALLNEFVATKKSADDKDQDLQLAAEIGQMLLEKNTRTEEIAVELQKQVDDHAATIRRLERQCDLYKHHVEELSATNMTLVQLTESNDEFLESTSLTEFLKQELEDSIIDGGFRGDPVVDLQAFRKKLRRERKQHLLAAGSFEETLAAMKEERDQAVAELQTFRERADANAALIEKNALLQKQVDEMSEKMRQQNIEHLSFLKRKRDAIKNATETEANALRQIDELRKELTRERETNFQERESSNNRIKSLNEENATLRTQLDRLRVLIEADKGNKGEASANDAASVEELRRAHTTAVLKYELGMADLRRANELLTQRLEVAGHEQKRLTEQNAELLEKLTAFKDVGVSLKAAIEKEREKSRAAQLALAKDRQEATLMESRIEALERQLAEASSAPKATAAEIEAERRRRKQLEDEKTTLEVKLMILQKKDATREEELKKKEAELKLVKRKAADLAKERSALEAKFHELEKGTVRAGAVDEISQQLQNLMSKYSNKEVENSVLQAELQKLRSLLEDIEEAKEVKRYKEMGKEMLATMKRMDQDMKELVVKYESVQTELKEVHKEKRKLTRRNEELTREVDISEKQMSKLMQVLITGSASC